MDLTKKKSVPIVDEGGKDTKHTALLFGNNAAWHCVLCGELNGDRTGDSDTVCQCCGKKYKILTAEGDSKRGAAVGVCALTMTVESLAQQLTELLARAAAKQEKGTGAMFFGVRYDTEMRTAGVDAKQVAMQMANTTTESYNWHVEVKKGRNLAKHVKIIKPL